MKRSECSQIGRPQPRCCRCLFQQIVQRLAPAARAAWSPARGSSLITRIVKRLPRQVDAHHANRSAPAADSFSAFGVLATWASATASGIVQRLRRRAPSHFQSSYKVWYGVGCQIRRQAGHGAAHSLATCLEAAELILRPAGANAQIFLKRQTAILEAADTHTQADR